MPDSPCKLRRSSPGEPREPLVTGDVREPLIPKEFDFDAESPKSHAVTPLKLDVQEHHEHHAGDVPPPPEACAARSYRHQRDGRRRGLRRRRRSP